jgi:hypothetical protein
MHRKKNVESLQQSQQVAIDILKNQFTNQEESLQERLRNRKLQLFKRRQQNENGMATSN